MFLCLAKDFGLVVRLALFVSGGVDVTLRPKVFRFAAGLPGIRLNLHLYSLVAPQHVSIELVCGFPLQQGKLVRNAHQVRAIEV